MGDLCVGCELIEPGGGGAGTSPVVTTPDTSRGTGIPTSWINMQFGGCGGGGVLVVSRLISNLQSFGGSRWILIHTTIASSTRT